MYSGLRDLASFSAAALLLGCAPTTSTLQSPSTPGASRITALSRLAPDSPGSILRSYYDAINHRSYRRAYGYLAPIGRPAYRGWVKGYRSTQHVTINQLRPAEYRISAGGATYTCVGIQFSAAHGGNKTDYGGWYAMWETGGGGWRIDVKGSRIAYHGAAQPPSRSTCLAGIRAQTVGYFRPCRASAVGLVAFWQGTASSQVGAMIFTDRGATCVLNNEFGVTIIGAKQRALPVTVVRRVGDAGQGVVLQHGTSARSSLRWVNWCRASAASHLQLRVAFPKAAGILSTVVRYGSAQNPQPAHVPTCVNASRQSSLHVGPVEKQP